MDDDSDQDTATQDPALSAAQEKNLKRIRQANLDDELIIGKYLCFSR
jgi:hypothetical protein